MGILMQQISTQYLKTCLQLLSPGTFRSLLPKSVLVETNFEVNILGRAENRLKSVSKRQQCDRNKIANCL